MTHEDDALDLELLEVFSKLDTKSKEAAINFLIGLQNYDSKLEAEYALYLEQQLRQGLVRDYRRPAPTLPILGGKSRYTADFFVVTNDGTIEMHEVKGFWTDVGLLRFKAAGNEWPQFAFKAIEKKRGAFLITREL